MSSDAQPSSIPVQIPDNIKAKIDHWVAKYPADQKQSAVLSALHIVQEHNGWITPQWMDAVAEYLEMPKVSVYEVGTFYSMLELEPVGRHIVSICNNISCMLCGADDIVEYVEQKLDIRLGATTADGRITLKQEEECLAACAGAHLTREKIDEILDGLE